MTVNSNYLFKSDGLGVVAADDQRITGIQINEGAHLILPQHASNSYVSLSLQNDIQNNGALTVQNIENDASREDLNLYVAAYYGTGSIDLSGDSTRTNGQNAGDIQNNSPYNSKCRSI